MQIQKPILGWLRATLAWFARLTLLITCSALLVSTTPRENTHSTTALLIGGQSFNFVRWTVDALAMKVATSASSPQAYLTDEQASQLVRDFFANLDRAQQIDRELQAIYSDPSRPSAEALLAERDALRSLISNTQPIAEAILQEQVAVILREEGFAPTGMPIPPVAFHITPLPRILVISARDEVRQIHAAGVQPDLSIPEQEALEQAIDAELDASSLIVPIGGLALYPTMVYETGNLAYMAELVAHEWSHNWLTMRPLGLNYSASNDLRTINETTATIFGQEIGALVLQRFYPELYRPPPPPPDPDTPVAPPPPPDPNRFDFRAEMYTTRVITDTLLRAGRIEYAEAYMEARRQVFVENGYAIRKLNQAYFAFYGAYAASPGGASGQDLIGPKVVAVRYRSPTLLAFMHQMAWVSSVDNLETLVQTTSR